MPQLLSFPFRVRPDGRAATVMAGSDKHRGEQLAQLVGTLRGERALVIDFGMADPTFWRYDIAEIVSQIDLWDLDIDVTALDVVWPDTVTQQVTITYE